MSENEHRSFTGRLASYVAPTLLGIKCGGLLSLSAIEFDIPANLEYFNGKAISKGLKIRQLCGCGERRLIFVYNEALLEKRIGENETRLLLKEYGYTDFSVDGCLERLSERINADENFPHEIGVFLDYPIDDITGFIKNKGRNYKLCGCRKVYGSVEKAKRDFENYDKCRNYLFGKLSSGWDIYRALKIS